MDINAGLELYHASENAVLVDLRDEEDYRKGHIPGAVHALLGNIRQEIRKIATFRTPVFLYCYVGSRCTQAEALLKAKGYENALGIGGLDQYSGELEASEPMESPVPESAEDERIKKTDLVRELRVSRGLSQADFAGRIGISPVTVSALENGRMGVSRKIADAIREAFGEDIPVPEKKKRGKRGKADTPEIAAENKANKIPKERKVKKTGAHLQAAQDGRGFRTGDRTDLLIQSPDGREITPTEILRKVGSADRIYVRVDENRAYWVRGNETGNVELWDE